MLHAELRDYLEHAAVGAALGSGLGAGGALLPALAAGIPITLAPILAAAGLGALVAALL